MVCPIGSGKMAVMARLLAAVSVSQKIAEEVGHQKLAAQYIYRELLEADEANLLDEEDMHIFGLMPMTDPLHLVCCNACKKPVKASQYAAHAELCTFLNSAEEMKSTHDGGVGHRKTPRKERKKLLTGYINQASFVGEQEGSESIDADDANASEAWLNGQPGIHSFSMDTKRNPVCVDVASILDGEGVSPGNTFHSACIMPPPTKRSKLTSSRHQSDDPSTASGLTKSTTTQDIFTCRDFQMQSTSGSDMPNNCIASKYPQQVHEHYLLKDTPVPLAAKIYYSQRENRLRPAIAHLYYVTSAKGLHSNVLSPELSQDSIMQLQALSQWDTSHGQADDLLDKKREHSAHKPDQIRAQSSELCFDKSGGCVPVTNFSNQFPSDNILRPQTAPVGLPRSKYIPKPYSFDNDSGKSHGTVQQENGRVPVL